MPQQTGENKEEEIHWTECLKKIDLYPHQLYKIHTLC